jgi:hypothetical protein
MVSVKRRELTVDEWCWLFTGTAVELAELCEVSRQGLRDLRLGHHQRMPSELLRRLAAALEGRIAGNDRSPDAKTLQRSWLRQWAPEREGKA